jgi:ribosomal protein L11 methyltransferase
VIVKAYLPINSFLGETVEQIKNALNNLILYDIDLGKGTVSLTEVHEEEWATAWKKYYKPVRISERIVVTPTWEEYEPESENEIIIELDPGMAFGTGTHPTTVMCVQALEKYVKPGDEVIDVGCGTGILSISAAKLGAEKVHSFDLDEQAVQIARLNAKLNKVGEQVDVRQNNLLDGVQGPVDLIVANILAEVILRFVGDAYQVLKSNGLFIVSGIIHAKEAQVRQELERNGFRIIDTYQIEDWYAFVAEKAV